MGFPILQGCGVSSYYDGLYGKWQIYVASPNSALLCKLGPVQEWEIKQTNKQHNISQFSHYFARVLCKRLILTLFSRYVFWDRDMSMQSAFWAGNISAVLFSIRKCLCCALFEPKVSSRNSGKDSCLELILYTARMSKGTCIWTKWFLLLRSILHSFKPERDHHPFVNRSNWNCLMWSWFISFNHHSYFDILYTQSTRWGDQGRLALVIFKTFKENLNEI